MDMRSLRSEFLSFFASHGHTIVPSSSLIPADDPTLLFANAGMNQFKDIFLGKTKAPYNRATSLQKCIRAGGKHNDLDNVGYTARHLTFFEMMGNFSFGDYFKEDAIWFAWNLLTGPYGLAKDKLYVSVHHSDDEAYNIWHKLIGVSADHIVKLGDADNFWQMGDVGPCGPCTEIYIDQGPEFGTGPDNSGPGSSGDRFIEVWNLVFMQYNRQADGTLVKLTRTGVDTGMGFERICAVTSGKKNVFETDVFTPLLDAIGKVYQKPYAECSPKEQVAFRVIADHSRSSAFAIADGAEPSKEGRGYVVRKILRRGALFAQKVGGPAAFLASVDAFINFYQEFYPELHAQRNRIRTSITAELNKFNETLESGISHFNRLTSSLPISGVVPGKDSFTLYDTYGFPLEVTTLLAHERGLTIDLDGFNAEMELQRVRSSAIKETSSLPTNDEGIHTAFVGYDSTKAEGTILRIAVRTSSGSFIDVDELISGSEAFIFVDRTPFYAEKGGQVSDQGTLTINKHACPVEKIFSIGGATVFQITAPTTITKGDAVIQDVDAVYRKAIAQHHSATHLLQSALNHFLGNNLTQAGSLVSSNYLRFDFTYDQAIDGEVLKNIETMVNQHIQANVAVCAHYMSLSEAQAKGAKAFFGEKYTPERVRLVEMETLSKELCGGTHVHRTGDIGMVKIIECTSLSAGVRRIVACAGMAAIAQTQTAFDTTKALSLFFKVPQPEIVSACAEQAQQFNASKKQYQALVQTYLKDLVHKELEKPHTTKWGSLIALEHELLNAENFVMLESYAKQESSNALILLIAAGKEQRQFLLALPKATTLNETALKEALKTQGISGGGKGGRIMGGGAAGKVTIETMRTILENIK